MQPFDDELAHGVVKCLKHLPAFDVTSNPGLDSDYALASDSGIKAYVSGGRARARTGDDGAVCEPAAEAKALGRRASS